MFRLRSAVADLIGRTPGLRSVLGPVQKLTHLDPKERHAMEEQALARRHERERREIERRRRMLAAVEKREQRSLERAIEKRLRAERIKNGGDRQTITEPVRTTWKTESRLWRKGDLRTEFGAAMARVDQ